MTSRPIVLWGKRGQAIVIAEIAKLLGYRLLACVDDDPGTPSPFPGVPGLGGVDELIELLAQSEDREAVGFAVAIGAHHGRVRLAKHALLERHNLEPTTLVHPTAYVAGDALVGPAAQVLIRAVVGPRSSIGPECIVNTGATVDHECTLHEGVHIGPGATVAGRVDIGPAAFIGAGAVVLPELKVGADAIVGAGAVVTHDVARDSVVVGNPARIRP
jgi:sugar O-acyltransferase (sialic acid O-acetyltransferase NeuD family)